MALNQRTLRPSGTFSPRSIPGLALWLDASDPGSTYTTDAGPVVAVASPLDIAGCTLWLDASDPASITASGGEVTQWTDKSATGSTWTIPSGFGGPTTGSTTLGGKNALLFDGVNDVLKSSGNPLGTALPLTFFIVQRIIAPTNFGTSYVIVPSTKLIIRQVSTFGWVDGFVGGLSDSTNRLFRDDRNRTGLTDIYTIVFPSGAGTTNTAVVNGAGLATTNSTLKPDVQGDHYIGCRLAFDTTPEQFANIAVAEIIAFNTALTTAQRASVESYLATKWGISGVHRSAAQEIAAVTSPTEIAGLTEWFDATDTSGTVTTVAGNKISSWASKVAGGRTLTQADDTRRPVMTDNIQNGLRMAKFDGVDDFIRTATPETFADKTVFIVSRPTDVSANQAVWGASKQNITLYGYYYSAGFRVSSAAITVRPETAGAAARRIAASANEGIITALQFKTSELLAANFASILPYKNGTLFDTNDSVVLADYAIGSTMGANDSRPAAGVLANFYSGYVGEVLIYDAYLSAVDRARVEKYLQQKWATPTVPDPTPPVGYWQDKSGNNRHAVQATAGSRPLVGTQNSRKALTFDGLNDKLSRPLTSAVGTNAVTFLAVVNHNLTGQPTFLTTPVDISSGNGGRPITRWASSSNDRLFTGISFADVATNYRSRSGRFLYALDGQKDAVSSGTHTLRDFANGALVGSGNITATWQTSPQVLCVGSRDDDGVQYKGDICEVLVYDKILTTAERQRAERYLAARWGITLAPQVSNLDAQDWINRVYQNGGTVSAATAGAVNSLCESLESSGLRDRFFRLNLFCGNSDASLAAVRTPLFRGPSLGGTQYGNTTDTNNNFLAADYSEASGLQGNGSTKYLNTGVPMNFSGLRDYHLSSYVSSVTSGSPGFLGADTNGDGVSPRAYQALVSFSTSPRTWVWYNWGNTGITQSDNTSNSYAPGLISGVASAANNALYVGSSSVATAAALSSNELTTRTFPIFVFAINNRNANILNYANARLGGYSLGLAMNATQVGQYNTALAAFNSAMGRA